MEGLIYKDLSYRIVGLCYAIHNLLGPACKEIQYKDGLEVEFKGEKIKYEREKEILFYSKNGKIGGNRVDFVINNQIILEAKSKMFLTPEDKRQVLRYLKVGKYKLGLLVNFRGKKVNVCRIVNSDLSDDIGINTTLLLANNLQKLAND